MAVMTLGSRWQTDVFTLQRGLFDVAPFIKLQEREISFKGGRMFRFLKIALFIVFFSQCTFSDFTIHVLNPWKNDTSELLRDSLRMSGNNEVGYYPGTTMIPEGNGWFYYTYKTETVSFEIVDWIGPADYLGRVVYPKAFRLDSLFALFPATTNELWIAINDTSDPPVITDHPPGTTQIRSLQERQEPFYYSKLNQVFGLTNIDIYDMSGRCVQRLESKDAQSITLATRLIPAGRYFMKITNGKAIRTVPITIMR
jgi:hypothetical protein